MDIVKNNQRKNLFKKGGFSVCCLTVFAFLQASHINASKPGEGYMDINEPEEGRIIGVSKKSLGKSECESGWGSGCGGIDVEVKAPGIDVKVSAKQANVKGGIKGSKTH